MIKKTTKSGSGPIINKAPFYLSVATAIVYPVAMILPLRNVNLIIYTICTESVCPNSNANRNKCADGKSGFENFKIVNCPILSNLIKVKSNNISITHGVKGVLF